MSKLQIYPVTVNDYIPFLCFIIEQSAELALQLAEKTFPSLKTMGELELLEPISIDRESSFVVDPELYIINYDDEIKYWLGDSGAHYSDNNINQHLEKLFDDALPTKESEDKNVKLLPAKSSEKTTDRKDEKDSDKFTEKSNKKSGENSEEKDEEKDKIVWV